MPTFPHHRNMKTTNVKSEPVKSKLTLKRGISELPALSDILGTIVKKKRNE